jgi:hypothetical protein
MRVWPVRAVYSCDLSAWEHTADGSQWIEAIFASKEKADEWTEENNKIQQEKLEEARLDPAQKTKCRIYYDVGREQEVIE